MLRANAKLKIEIEDAEIVARALKPDDLDWCYCYVENGKIVIIVETDKIGAMLNAIDDYFINLKAVKGLFEAMKEWMG